MIRRPPRSTLFPSRTPFRSRLVRGHDEWAPPVVTCSGLTGTGVDDVWARIEAHRDHLGADGLARKDRKSTRLNSSHANISYAVFCLKKIVITALITHDMLPR